MSRFEIRLRGIGAMQNIPNNPNSEKSLLNRVYLVGLPRLSKVSL